MAELADVTPGSPEWLAARSAECPYCHARPGEHCRTMNGNLTGRYGTRVNHYRREVATRKTRAAGSDRGIR